jgi:15-cis-phytoene synthase
MLMHEVSAEASIKNGSKSFSLAARFFPKEKWSAVCGIYHWCRYCDDEIDLSTEADSYSRLVSETKLVLVEKKDSKVPPFSSLKQVVEKYSIPAIYPLDLLKGMEMDSLGTRYQSLSDLELYCYRVASTVGLMMCYIMGLFRISALENAAHLGMAMQLTNMARDVKEDAGIGRVYLPLDWLKEKEIDPDNLFHNQEALFEVVERLLQKADEFYESGFRGIIDLPLRSAFVITAAALFYRRIGEQILTRGPEALNSRSYVTTIDKIILIVKALYMTLFSLPERYIRRRSPVVIDELWRIA